MELLLAMLGLAAGLVALGLVIGLRTQVAQLHTHVASLQAERETTRATVVSLEESTTATRGELDEARRELSELRAAANAPIPPLPRARPAGLDDLRERLRAAHAEPDDDEDEVEVEKKEKDTPTAE